MTAHTTTLRYKLPKKAVKSDCPDCGPRHRRTLSRYVDTRTGEPLPESYGRCDRESNCGYHLSPYQKSPSGLSYADELYQIWKEDQQRAVPRILTTRQPKVVTAHQPQPVERVVYSIPEEVFKKTQGHYERNQFAKLLQRHFGASIAADLLSRFQIGTSSRWEGACVFWYVDEQNRKRGGQIKLFGEDWHTVKYVDREGRKRSKTSWVHAALKYRLQKAGPIPPWLIDYEQQAECSPCLFGLPQLKTEPTGKPVAIVEAPKTAVLCSYYFPHFIWLAAGGKSYLNAERLAPIKNRKIVLFPDVNAYYDLINDKGQTNRGWENKVQQLQADGFAVTISSYLEELASEPEKEDGMDLADYLLKQWNGYPPDWDDPLLTDTLPTR
ncbi:DUF6371 domain-containing protein [Spirosoma validum]|uniref:Uncharacterized protein n=1 Tax=Spirosoma validum TaxID=2771355 RepID=A0A927AZP4_9BACT|nr:DUF6371 domain-containing protein [Spirosoma validum]MBD2752612.1 hypothetical protein [Spirosoma validum]